MSFLFSQLNAKLEDHGGAKKETPPRAWSMRRPSCRRINIPRVYNWPKQSAKIIGARLQFAECGI